MINDDALSSAYHARKRLAWLLPDSVLDFVNDAEERELDFSRDSLSLFLTDGFMLLYFLKI